jgi:uncharacterized membrane protein YfcA
MLSTISPHLRFIWLVVASTIAGVMNAMAGGGSFLSFPAMLGVGVPPIQANATNTVALWPGQLTSVVALRKDVRRDLMLVVGVTCFIGGFGGAEILLHTQQATFVKMIPWLILGGTVLFGLSGPVSRWLRSRAEHPHQPRRISHAGLAVAMMPVALYIGFFGAGSGFLTMTVLALFGLDDMHQLNAMKIFAVWIANFCAIVTFVARGAVVWHYCLVSMVFAGLGGYAGARLAKRIPAPALRAFVVTTGCVIAAYFFWKQA